MGHNFPKQLALNLQKAANIQVLIESGTYKAQTALWAEQHFAKVYTIEAYRPRFEKTLASIPNEVINRKRIHFIFGDSRDQLKHVLNEVNDPAILWLDAHWINDSPVDAQGECPLLGELEAINNHNLSDHHMVIVDDARLFEAPPPHPHDPKDWPPISTFINKIGTGKRFVMVDHDMIVSVPFQYREILQQSWY